MSEAETVPARKRGGEAAQLAPLPADQIRVEPLAEHRRQPAVAGLGLEGVEAAVVEVGDAREEVVAEQRAQTEDVVADAAAIGVVRLDLPTGCCPEQAVENMRGLAGRGGDDLDVEGRVAAVDVRVEADGRVAATVRVDGASRLAGPAQEEVLPIGGGGRAAAERARERHLALGLDKPREGEGEGLLAHVPGRDPDQLLAADGGADARHAGEAEVGRLGDERCQEGTSIGRRPTGLQVPEERREAGPAVDLLEHIGEPHRRQHGLEPRRRGWPRHRRFPGPARAGGGSAGDRRRLGPVRPAAPRCAARGRADADARRSSCPLRPAPRGPSALCVEAGESVA